ncbi:DUF2945 domain-containing protein [Phyllobacterium zundukense]|uniref:Hypervirulence associated protein TUDOR domain-containing protein n=1 Tax=Phyllobacterium zundukense TaxID=1867719 RepID=A0A2N9VSK7_9HYPH|nr:DUF2945 domain-containing protein [Phyllobacterium zundukense]ATU92891.1 hypothetical protein BLM14_15615 [Phyllobacterium zundukense]PIO42475.1 hypothetical protein B5P45_26070 [Phyllobacterium zundukense]
MTHFHKGARVEWGKGVGTGKIVEQFTKSVTRTIKGVEVTRKASRDEPAYMIEQDDGGRVLKSASELKAAK